jgi:photosystem II stability/assembly factor-like uncharacterized protein
VRHLIHLLFLACLLTACGGGSPTVTSATVPLPTETPASTPTLSSGPWQLVAVHNVHHSVMTAGFLNEDFGITGGVIGYMYYTTDGGQHWYEGTNQSDCRYGMDVVDTSVAWTCGGMMHVRRSTDGGQSWQAVTDFGQGTTKPCHTISFLDEKTGWLATHYMFGATEDGGQTWTMVPQPVGLDDIASIDLYAPGKGYLLDFPASCMPCKTTARAGRRSPGWISAALSSPKRPTRWLPCASRMRITA